MATVFTGAAALAGGYGPTALAATTAVHPDFTVQECGANDDGVSNWVHLYYPADDHPAECIGGATSYHSERGTIASFCPGNNYGTLWGSVGGKSASFYFSRSQGRHSVKWYDGKTGYFHLTGITIDTWSGDAKCG